MAERTVQLPLVAVAVGALATLPFLAHARNRLLSGQPIGFGTALAGAGALPIAALTIGAILLVTPLLWPRWRWASLVGTGLALAALATIAAEYASQADASGPAARTSLASGAWVAASALLLLASDTGRRLPYRPLAAFLIAAPLVVVLALGWLAPLSLLREYAAQRELFRTSLLRHIVLVAGAIGPALLIGVPLGVATQRREALRRVAFPVLNLIQTIPSIALFGLLIGPLSSLGHLIPGISGVGLVPALIALVLYALLPIVRNTVEGLDGVPAGVRTAARGMGMSPAQTFLHVDAALGLPVLLSGLRVTAVQAVGLAAVSALIGAGGLGAIMFQGLFANALDLVLLGALPVIALAVATDLLFRQLTAWSRTLTGAAT